MPTLIYLAADAGCTVVVYDEGVIVGGVLFATIDDAIVEMAPRADVGGEA